MVKAYEYDLKAPPQRVSNSRDPDESGPRKLRGMFGNENLKMKMLKDKNPKREGTHAYYNWNHCYKDGISISDYLARMDYPRDIIVKTKSGEESWFNGPAMIYVNSDFRAKLLGIYDSTKQPEDPEYWLKADAVEETNGETNGEESTEAETENNEKAA